MYLALQDNIPNSLSLFVIACKTTILASYLVFSHSVALLRSAKKNLSQVKGLIFRLNKKSLNEISLNKATI